MNFMRLITHGPDSAYMNMAIDEVLSEAVRQKHSPPTLRLYSWACPSLSLGYFQKTADIDRSYCAEKGYPVVRRLTGGRAVLHDSELTYSFSSSSDSPLFNGNLLENYTIISRALLLGLKLVGIDADVSSGGKGAGNHKNPACFKAVSLGEITVDNKKIIGSAQKRYKNGFLQHGSILLRFDPEELKKVLGQTGDIHFRDIGSLCDHVPEMSVTTLAKAIKKAFEKQLGVKMISDDLSASELKLARELASNKYSTPAWNYLR